MSDSDEARDVATMLRNDEFDSDEQEHERSRGSVLREIDFDEDPEYTYEPDPPVDLEYAMQKEEEN